MDHIYCKKLYIFFCKMDFGLFLILIFSHWRSVVFGDLVFGDLSWFAKSNCVDFQFLGLKPNVIKFWDATANMLCMSLFCNWWIFCFWFGIFLGGSWGFCHGDRWRKRAVVVVKLRVGLKRNRLLHNFEAQRMLIFARDCTFWFWFLGFGFWFLGFGF